MAILVPDRVSAADKTLTVNKYFQTPRSWTSIYSDWFDISNATSINVTFDELGTYSNSGKNMRIYLRALNGTAVKDSGVITNSSTEYGVTTKNYTINLSGLSTNTFYRIEFFGYQHDSKAAMARSVVISYNGAISTGYPEITTYNVNQYHATGRKWSSLYSPYFSIDGATSVIVTFVENSTYNNSGNNAKVRLLNNAGTIVKDSGYINSGTSDDCDPTIEYTIPVSGLSAGVQYRVELYQYQHDTQSARFDNVKVLKSHVHSYTLTVINAKKESPLINGLCSPAPKSKNCDVSLLLPPHLTHNQALGVF